mmetsp:Transcript_6662/g.7662  ORF Transcript_6662/g.7662 Transcript_6662/m.7662 type:complete len:265 (-) Transcript_6662:44-838(-)
MEEKTRRRILRAFLPASALLLLSVFWYKILFSLNHDCEFRMGTLIQFSYAILLTIGMEYIARYEHQYMWHSKALWVFHASHHHQLTKFGSGPSRTDAESNTFVSPHKQNSLFELNDAFGGIFGSLAMIAMYWTFDRPDDDARYIHDVVFGSSCGISIYGTSYFIGHDLCAHQRGGAELAALLRRISPTMAKCSALHSTYHHKIDVDNMKNEDDDPYGAPYGFWLGPQEIEALKENRELRMPWLLKSSFWVGGLFSVYAALQSCM